MAVIKIREKRNLINHLAKTRHITIKEASDFYNRMPNKEKVRRIKELGNVPFKSSK